MNPRALLLDLDGTIADTLPHIFDAYRHAVAPWTDRPPTNAEIEATFGPPEHVCVALLAPEADLDEAVRRFHEYHEAHHRQAVRIVDGLADVIDHAAHQLGWRIGVFTGKGRRPAEFSLNELGIRDRIEFLVSGTDVIRAKPDPEGIFLAAKGLEVPVDRILMAGDSPVDIEAGRSAGSRTAAVLWAAFRPDRLRASNPDFVCETADDLRAAVDSLHASG